MFWLIYLKLSIWWYGTQHFMLERKGSCLILYRMDWPGRVELLCWESGWQTEFERWLESKGVYPVG